MAAGWQQRNQTKSYASLEFLYDSKSDKKSFPSLIILGSSHYSDVDNNSAILLVHFMITRMPSRMAIHILLIGFYVTSHFCLDANVYHPIFFLKGLTSFLLSWCKNSLLYQILNNLPVLNVPYAKYTSLVSQ
jgi:hypothetical protein